MNLYHEVDCLERVKTFVKAGCDTHSRNVAGRTPFHIAAKRRLISVMEYLLSIHTSIPSDILLIALEHKPWSFISRNCYPVIRFLLERGCDTQVSAEDGNSLLHRATILLEERDALDVIKLLVHAGCSPRVLNSVLESPLHVAARYDCTSIINYYLSLGIPLPPDILLVASNWHTQKAKSIQFFIEQGADPRVVTENGDTALHLLLAHGNEADRFESAKLLIDAGCDPRARNGDGKTALYVAAKNGYIAVMEHLLSQDLTLPNDISLSSIQTIYFLIKQGIDPRSVATNYEDVSLRAAILYSHECEEDCLAHVKTLVELGWDLSSRDSAGDAAIHLVARSGSVSTLKYLLSQNVPLPTDTLLAAVPSRKRQCTACIVPSVQFLIWEGADVNATTANGDTPLHLALMSEFFTPNRFWGDIDDRNDLCKLIEILLNHGSNPYARNADGRTPVDLAEAKGHFFKENFLRLVRNSESSV